MECCVHVSSFYKGGNDHVLQTYIKIQESRPRGADRGRVGWKYVKTIEKYHVHVQLLVMSVIRTYYKHIPVKK